MIDTGGLESHKKKKGRTDDSLKKKIQITDDNNFIFRTNFRQIDN